MKPPTNIFYRWVLGTRDAAMRLLTRSLDKLHVGTARDQEGDTPGNMTGVPAGGVTWPVDPTTHDGASFIAADCFFAHYDATKKEVYCLDDANGTRHPGALPLKVPKSVKIIGSQTRSGLGVVYRTAEYGTLGLKKRVFIPVAADLVAHHRQPRPPQNSSQVHDPGEGNDDWFGGLHYPLRVRRFIRKYCSGGGGHSTTGDKPGAELFAPLFNMSRNGDGTDAAGAAHWARAEGALSDEAKGPLAVADDANHRLGQTKDATVDQGAIHIDALYGPVAGLYMPKEHIDQQWENGSKGPYIKRVEHRPDFNDKHENYCGKKVPGVLKWQTWADTTSYPPTEPPPPTVPPPKDPVTGPPMEPRPAPAMQKVIAPLPRPGTSSPGQIETPSVQGHAAPDAATGPDTERQSDSTYEQAWLNRFGFTEREFIESPIVADTVAVPVYESSSPNTSQSGPARWPTVKSQETIYTFDQDGRVLTRDRAATGGGSLVDMPANVPDKCALYGNDVDIPASPDGFARIVLSGLDATLLRTIDGRLGIGRRIHTSPYTVAGWEFRLGFGGAGGRNEPDLYLDGKTHEGATPSVGKFYVQGVEVNPSLAANAVTAASTFAAANRVIVADGADRSADDSDFTMTQDGTNVIGVSVPGNQINTAETFNGTSFNASEHIKSTSATAGIGYATGAGGTVTQATSKSTGVTLNKVCGQITMHNAALAAGTSVTFAVSCSAFAPSNDVVIVNPGGDAGIAGSDYTVTASWSGVADATFYLTVTNITTGSLSEALPIQFVIVKGVVS